MTERIQTYTAPQRTGDRIRLFRRANGLTEESLANTCGLTSRQMVWYWENRLNRPEKLKIAVSKICARYPTADRDWLLYGDRGEQ